MRVFALSVIVFFVAVPGSLAASWDPAAQIAPYGVSGSQIEDMQGIGQSPVMVKQDARGDVAVAWTRADPIGAYHVELSYKPAGQPWVGPDEIGPPHTLLLGLGMDAGGNTTVAYQSTDGTVAAAMSVVTRARGGSWGPVEPLGEPAESPNGPSLVALLVDDPGDVLVVYNDQHSSRAFGRFESAFRPVGGAWQAPVDLAADPSGGDVENMEVGMAADGEATMLEGFTSSPAVPHSRRFTPTGGWEAPVAAFTPPVVANGQAAPGAFGVSPTGEVMVVSFVATTYPQGQIMVTSRAPGATSWSPYITLGSTIPGDQCAPVRLAFDSAGEAIVACAGSNGPFPGSSVYAAIRSSGGSWGPLALVASDTEGGTNAAVLAMADDGHALMEAIANPTVADPAGAPELLERLPGQATWATTSLPPFGFANTLVGGPGHGITAVMPDNIIVGGLLSDGLQASLLSQPKAPLSPAIPSSKGSPRVAPAAHRFARIRLVGRRACSLVHHPCSTARRVHLNIGLKHGQRWVRITVQRLRGRTWALVRKLRVRPRAGRVTVTLPRGRVRVSTATPRGTKAVGWVLYLVVR
jgi:hypothetical protein